MARARLVEEVEVVVMLIAGSREMVASSSSAQHKGSPRRKKSLKANIDSRYKINIVSYYEGKYAFFQFWICYEIPRRVLQLSSS